MADIKSNKQNQVGTKENCHISNLQTDDNLCYLTSSEKCIFFHNIIEQDDAEFVKYCIKLGVNVDATDSVGDTPLMVAIKNNNVAMVSILLDAKANVFMPDKLGSCALGQIFKSEFKITKSIKYALLTKVTVDSLINSPYIKCKSFHDDCPLYNFIPLRNENITRILLKKGSPVDAQDPIDGRTALHVAVEQSDMDNIKLLIEYQADVNKRDFKGQKPLALSLNNNDKGKNIEIVKVLLNAGTELIDHDKNEILLTSILSNGNIELLRTVLQCNIDLHVKNKYSKTPFEYLIENRNPDIYKELTKFKIKLNISSEKMTSILNRAVTGGKVSLVEYLIIQGANVNAKDARGWTCLFWAINPTCYFLSKHRNIEERLSLITMLLERGADPLILTKENYNLFEAFSKPVDILTTALIEPVFTYMALHEASGTATDQFMRTEVAKRPEYECIYISKIKQLEDMKKIEIDDYVTLFDFLIVNKIAIFAENKVLISNLSEKLKESSIDSYYYRKLHERFLKLTQMAAVNDIFVKLYNVSVINIAEKIVNYLKSALVYR